MINIYSKYYLSEAKILNILKDGIVVFDTSALLDLYYYSNETRVEIFEKVFKYLKDRLWIPSQVYFEYLKNKEIVSQKPIATYESLIVRKVKGQDGGHIATIFEISEVFTKKILEINNQIKTLKEQTLDRKKHPYLFAEVYVEYEKKIKEYEEATRNFVENTRKFKELFSAEVDRRIDEIKSDISPDIIVEKIENSFQIGSEYSYTRMNEIAREGIYRYEQQIPPGYKDEDNKVGLQKFGDLFAWMQILDYAHKQRKDFILVTNDLKNDWFEEDKETPRFELLKEFNEKANKSIWLMSMKKFLWEINSLLDEQLGNEIFEDVDSVEDNKSVSHYNDDSVFEMIQEIFKDILRQDIYMIDTIPQNEEIRVFNAPYLFEAESELGIKYRIITTMVGGSNYARMLHAMTNAFEIKKFYEKNKENYQYYNFIIIKNKDVKQKCMEHLTKKKVKNMFNNASIRTIICYLEDEKLFIEKANYSISD